jgi:hypothetical protein
VNHQVNGIPSRALTVDSDAQPTRTSTSLSELSDAIAQFKDNYEKFAKENSTFILIDKDIQAALQDAQAEIDIRSAARIFSDGIWGALRTVEAKKKAQSTKWTTRLGNALTKLYPIARLSLGAAQIVGTVNSMLTVIICRDYLSHRYRRQLQAWP